MNAVSWVPMSIVLVNAINTNLSSLSAYGAIENIGREKDRRIQIIQRSMVYIPI